MSEVKENKIALPVFSAQGAQVGEIEVSPALFAAAPRPQVLQAAAEAYLANQRQGNAASKTRGEVAGSTRKLYRQKGTGRARAGSRRSPTRVGGGTAFGPHPRDYRQRLPQKVRRLALSGALSDRAAAGEIKVLDSLALEKISTKTIATLLEALGLTAALKRDQPVALLVTDTPDEVLRRSARNIPGLALGRAADLNAYAVLQFRQLLFTRAGLARLQEVFG